MSNPLLTVVIPVYNRANLVKDTLQSLADQTLQVFDVVLVDNNSTDNSLAVLQQWADEHSSHDRRITVLSEAKRGACAARNRGASEVKTPWVMFFDSDDLMDPSHLADFEEVARSNPEADLITRPVYFRTAGGGKRLHRYCRGEKRALFNHIFHATLSTQRYIVKTSFYEKTGGWDPKVWGWNDYELGVRLLLQHPRVATVPGPPSMLVVPQKESITGTAYSTSPRKWEDALDKCQRDLEQAGRHDMIKYINCRRAILAGTYRLEGDMRDARRLLASVKGWRYRAVYLHRRFLRRGAAYTVRLLFG